MKRTIFMLLIITLAAALAMPASVQAQKASTQTWTSSIYYYSPDADGNVQVAYFNPQQGSDSAQGTSANIPVKAHGSGSIFIGEISTMTDGFKGSAVLSASVPILAVYEQSPSGDPNYARLLYSAFDISQSSKKFFIPSFVNDPRNYMSQVGVQNVSTVGITTTLRFYKPDGSLFKTVTSPNIRGSLSYIFNPGDINAFDPVTPVMPVDTSLVIEVNGGTAADKIVAAAEELQNTGRRAYAYEGIPDEATATTIFMPSMMCKYGHGAQISTYIMQNTAADTATVTVSAYNENGTTRLGAPKTLTIPSHGKVSLSACSINSATLARNGSAVIRSDQKLAVIGKVQGTDGLMTSFTGQNMGTTRVVLPFAMWAANALKGYQSYISIMNVNQDTTVGVDKTAHVTVTYYGDDGKSKVAPVLAVPQYAKRSVNPKTAGATTLRPDGTFRGAMEITSDQPVVVLIRMERKISGVSGYGFFGEDYTGINYLSPGP